MRALIWKELRENARWALLAMLALGGAEIYALYHQEYPGQMDVYFNNGITICKKAFLTTTLFGCAATGVALGLLQILPELKRDRWAALLHRPMSRGKFFWSKAIAGLALYFVATGVPLGVAIYLVATPGHFGTPFVPEMVQPGLADTIAGLAYYFAALLAGLQGGRIALRALPIFAAVHLSFFMLGEKLFRVALEASFAMTLALCLAGWGAMQQRESPRSRPWIAWAALLVVAFYGACGAGDQLSAADTFALVAYDSTVQVLVPAQHLEDRDALKRRVERIESGGSTALYEGVERGAAELAKFSKASHINRVLLLSDGLANIGPSSTEDVCELGRRLARRGLSVSTIGVGDDYNEDLMAGLAAASDANYYYVRDAEKLPAIFAKELGQLLAVTARDIRIEIVCGDDVEPVDLVGRPEKFERRRAVVQLSPFASGQARYLFLRCKIGGAREIERRDLARVKLTYLDELNGAKEQTSEQTVQIGFTKSEEHASASVDRGVAAERELQLNALVKDTAIASADAGKNKDAAQALRAQATRLATVAASAPAQYQSSLHAEAKNARDRAERLEEAPMSSALPSRSKASLTTRGTRNNHASLPRQSLSS